MAKHVVSNASFCVCPSFKSNEGRDYQYRFHFDIFLLYLTRCKHATSVRVLIWMWAIVCQQLSFYLAPLASLGFSGLNSIPMKLIIYKLTFLQKLDKNMYGFFRLHQDAPSEPRRARHSAWGKICSKKEKCKCKHSWELRSNTLVWLLTSLFAGDPAEHVLDPAAEHQVSRRHPGNDALWLADTGLSLISSCCSCSSAPSSRQSAWRGQYTPAGLCARQSGQVVRGECRHTGNTGLWLVNSDNTDLWLVDRFPWPPMLDCDKFPLDNDMCITAQSVRSVWLLIGQNKSRNLITGLLLVKWPEYWPLIGWQGGCWGLPGVRRGGDGDWGAARQQRQGWVVILRTQFWTRAF